MGQQHSAHEDDASCFRACLRDKKAKTLKSPAGPLHSPHNPPNTLYSPPAHYQPPESTKKPPPLPATHASLKDSQTSLEIRCHFDTKPNTQVRGAPLSEQKETVVQQKIYDENLQQVGALGLQSKFSSYRSRTKVLGKGYRTSQGVTHCGSEKEVGSSEQTSTKSQQTEGSTRSRRILLNKIEDIKQKYFQRELEIEIYQEEHEYQQQLDQLAKLEQKCETQGQPLTREINNVKKNILDKFNKRKLIRNNVRKQNPPEEQGQSNDELELYSRNNIHENQPQQDLKSSKRSIGNQKLNRSTKSIDGNQDVSLQQRVEFSQYSQQDTLQEIRQCDEEEEDYKSKVQQIRGVGSKPPPSKNLNKQPSEAISQKHSESAKSIKARGVQLSKCTSAKQIRASASPRSNRGEGADKLLFF